MKKAEIVIKYSIFAGVAIGLNIFAQSVVLYFYKGIFNLYFAIFCGTGTGLIAKYLLDKKYIFLYKAESKLHDAKKFTLYVGTGIITTIIFWSSELLAEHFWHAKFMGATIGLAIGYFMKYNLDKKFVFTKEIQSNE